MGRKQVLQHIIANLKSRVDPTLLIDRKIIQFFHPHSSDDPTNVFISTSKKDFKTEKRF